jgi:CRISPR type III-A-associated RAMP protein Csm4
MNPGMVVKLRPTGPWRIGPDSGARNRVDAIYHSDTLYGAVTSAMAVLGRRDEWLDATARASAPAVCFSSCFPFLDEIGFVAPPRTVWPPTSPGLMAARVRWKSARFVPLGIVQAILGGKRLDDSQWTVDGASECLVPAGRSGPFRTGVRWNAAVDRLSGSAERHSTACLEFRPGAGLWTVVSFTDDGSRERWSEPVKAAFRWLADSGFGGERSRGWGRSEAPEFVEGSLPSMILGAEKAAKGRGPGAREVSVPVVAMAEEAPVAEAGGAVPAQQESSIEAVVDLPVEAPAPDPAHANEAEERAAGPASVDEPAPVEEPPVEEPPVKEPPAENPPAEEPPAEEPPAEGPPATESSTEPTVSEPTTGDPPMAESTATEAPEAEPSAEEPPVAEASTEPATTEPTTAEPSAVDATSVPEPPAEEPPAESAEVRQRPEVSPMTGAPAPGPRPPVPHAAPFWLLSLYAPAADEAVDWARGNYSLVTRGGRVDASGDLKKQLPMVVEGSVLYAAEGLRGSAPDVAPDGFAHPVFRAGFAVSIPLPEVAG